jgi:hypothetical protein
MLQQQSVKSDQMQSELRELQQPGEGGVMLGRTTVSSQQYLTDIQQSQQHYAVVVGNHQRMLQQSQPQAQVSQGQLNQSQGIIQYPSAVYDWGNTNLGRARSAQQQQKAGLDVALWLNNTNLQVRKWYRHWCVPSYSSSHIRYALHARQCSALTQLVCCCAKV